MSGHVVVPVESCASVVPTPWRCPDRTDLKRCDGCLGNGTRAVLDDAVPVELSGVFDHPDSVLIAYEDEERDGDGWTELWQEVPR